jgi:hypothetical protein
MAAITIEGSSTLPNTYLRPGRRMTVERTELVDKMIRRGFAVVIAEEKPAAVEVAPAQELDHLRGVRGTEPPARNASRDEWAEFLTAEEVPFDEDATRGEMIAAWDARYEEVSEDGDPTD